MDIKQAHSIEDLAVEEEYFKEFLANNQSLIKKCKEIKTKVQGMRDSCHIAKSVGDGVANTSMGVMASGAVLAPATLGFSLIASITGGVTYMAGLATSYGTDITANVILNVLCGEIRSFAEQWDKSTQNMRKSIRGLQYDCPLKVENVIERVNDWNNDPSVKDIDILIQDLEEDQRVVQMITNYIN